MSAFRAGWNLILSSDELSEGGLGGLEGKYTNIVTSNTAAMPAAVHTKWVQCVTCRVEK